LPWGSNQPASQTADPLADLGFPRAIRFGSDYWLSRCVGFRVEWPSDGRGTVEEVRFGSRHDRPDLLLVRAGRLRPRRLLVRTDEVASLSPRERSISLSENPFRAHGAP
jgi:hypothetical protein